MDSILKSLSTSCMFPWLFADIVDGSPAWAPEYRRKIGHLRADHDGFRWWSTWWPTNPNLLTPKLAREINGVYDALIDKRAFPALGALRRFCEAHPEAAANPNCQDEYNFYYEGKYNYYWIRVITRERDYNLYLHAFYKGEI